jgi:uncharacterized repeat protein (TIGR03803 family)
MRLGAIAAVAVFGGMILAGIAPANAQTYKQIYSFPGKKHGDLPDGDLINFHGKLLGTTQSGGTANCECGTIFTLNRATGKVAYIYNFQGGTDGSNPQAGLTIVGNLLYGTTPNGGPADAGTIYSFDPSTHAKTIVYAFPGGGDASVPRYSLLNVAGTLYGVTAGGGPNKAGAIFSFDTVSGTEQILYFLQAGDDAGTPSGGLVDIDGVLLGPTSFGGDFNGGTVFSLDLGSGTETVLHSFGHKADGEHPVGALTKIGNKLYGATTFGGDNSEGTIFSINPATGHETVEYSFDYGLQTPDGKYPESGLLDVQGILYSTTVDGGSSGHCPNGCGTVFAFDPASGAETTLYSFQAKTDGYYPEFNRLLDVAGTLYGTTNTGGTGSKNDDTGGTVFSLIP